MHTPVSEDFRPMRFVTIVGSLLLGCHLAVAGLLHLGSLDPAATPAAHCCVCPWHKPALVSGSVATAINAVGALFAVPMSPPRLTIRPLPLFFQVAALLSPADVLIRTSRGPPPDANFSAQEIAGVGV